MKKTITSLIMLVLILPIYSQSYHTITIDGTNDFNTSYEQMSTTSGTSLYAYVTWDASNIYVGLSGSSPAGTVTDNARVYHIYIDTDPQTTLTSGNGTVTGESWRWQPTLPFNADYHYAFKTTDNSEFKRYYSGGSWADATITTSNWKGAGYWEFSINRSDIGSPSAINMVVYVEEDWSGGNICGGLPSNLFTNTTTSGAITFNNYWKGYELTSGLTPNGIDFNNRRFVSGSETVTTSISWSGLTILSGGTLTIDVNGALTLDGSLVNRGTSPNVLINSDATGTGSLIFQSGTPAATVQRYLTTYTTNNNGWHYLSSPVSGFTISGSDFEPVAGTDDLYRFDETKSSENWLNYDNASFSETHFQSGEGYLVAYSGATASNPKTFTGNLVSGDQPIYDLSYTSSATYPGWNLFGNPFTSAIDWDLIAKSSNVNGTVYVVKSSDGTNASWNGSTGDLTDGIIPAMQGFFVNTDQTGESIFIPASSQVHNSTSVDYFKNSSKLADQTFKISLSNTDFNNNTYIQFRDDASEAFDIAIDGYKLFGFGTAPEIYTKIDDTDYSINCLPADVASYNLPLGVKIQHDGVYNLTFEGFSTFANKVNLTLEDLLTGKTVAINEGSVYTFTHTNGDSEMRFLLHFAGVNGVSSPGADAKAAIIFSSNKTIVVKSLNTSLNGTVEVVNMIGQTLHVQHVDGASVSINTGLTNGVYIVRYKSDRGVLQTDKVILR